MHASKLVSSLCFCRFSSLESSILKSPILRFTGSQALPVTKLSPVVSPTLTTRETVTTPSLQQLLPPALTTPPLHQQPVAVPHVLPYHFVDVEVQLKKGCHDILLEGKVGVVSNISGNMATVRIWDNSSDITIPRDSLEPVPPRAQDTVKVLGGNESVLGLVGTLVSTIGNDGIVQFISINKNRKKNPAQIPLSQLGRYRPKSRFTSGLPLGMFPKRLGGPAMSTATITGGGSSATTTTTTGPPGKASPILFPVLYAVPAANTSSLSPFFTASLPRFVSSSSSGTSSGSGVTLPASLSTSHLINPRLSFGDRSLSLFGGSRTDKSNLPDSTSSATTTTVRKLPWDADKDFVTALPSRTNPLATPTASKMAAYRNLFDRKDSEPAKNRLQSDPASLVSTRRTVDRPTGQLFTFPISLNGILPGGMRYAGQSSFPKPVSRGGGSGSSNGYSISEILEKLVKNQRDYAYELTSPMATGGCG